jgi:hypothetical protein
MFNRRQLIKRGMVGLAALVGLPEQEANAGQELMLGPEETWTIVWPEPAMTIRHEGPFNLWRDVIEVPFDATEWPDGATKWRTYKPGDELFVTLKDLQLPEDQFAAAKKADKVWLELSCGDYDMTAWGKFIRWKRPGDFTFRIVGQIEEVVVKKQFPSEGDRIYRHGDVVIHNSKEFVCR